MNTKTNKTNPADVMAYFNDVTNKLEEVFTKKVPAMPNNAKEMIVNYGPYLTILVLVLSLPTLLFFLGISTPMMPYSYYGGMSTGFRLSLPLIFLVITLVLEAMAVPGLIARTKAGWNLVYYASWLNTVYSLLSGNIVSMVISFAVSMWVLFQIRSYYSK